ncbi:integrase [Methylorubrum extorquens]|uniref:tyrosine-type recombinase/integrase n=1 Tax=Methylorubrum extorquens TaxID=408 RepID=UPI002238F6C8|nr:integrase [Methylorubrum extorquens]UYW28391.1 integrase [Methylorubrum extorquens]
MGRKREGASLLYEEERKQWTIRDYDPVTGKRVKIRLDRERVVTRGQAEKEFAHHVIERERVADQQAREVIAPDPEDEANKDPRLIPIATVLTFYLQKQKEGSSNATLAAIHVEHLVRHWGARMLSKVAEETCLDYVRKRMAERWVPPGAKGPGKPISEQTAGRELQTLSAAIGRWHRSFTLNARPLVTLPEPGEAHPDWLTETEYGRLLRVVQGWRWVSSDLATREPIWERARDTAFTAQWRASAGEGFWEDDHLERFCEIGFFTGTRSAAILNLRWQKHETGGHPDFARTTLFRVGPKFPKSRKRNPACRIHDRLLPRLREWRKADAERMVTGEDGKPTGVTHIVHERGVPLARVGKAFGRAALLAGLDRRDIDGVMRIGNRDPADDLGLPSPHILRHTRATLMLQAGIAPREVGEYLGMSTAMVEKVYGHHHPEYQQRAAAA